MVGNNLPSPADVVKLYRSNGIGAMRIYAPERNVLRALSGTGIGLLMDVPNENITAFASTPSAAAAWVKANVQPYPVFYIAICLFISPLPEIREFCEIDKISKQKFKNFGQI